MNFDETGWAHWDQNVLPVPLDEAIAAFDRCRAAAPGPQKFGEELVKVAEPSELDATIKLIVDREYLASMVAYLMGWRRCYLFGDSLYYKRPHSDTRATVGWHQDLRYWPALEGQAKVAATAVIPLYVAERRSGGLGFVPGSHRWGLLGSEAWSGADNMGQHNKPPLPSHLERQWKEVYPVVQPGEVTFHHSLTFHGSEPNETDQHRRSITIHYTSHPGHGRRELWRGE